jgi:hypothetical protein
MNSPAQSQIPVGQIAALEVQPTKHRTHIDREKNRSITFTPAFAGVKNSYAYAVVIGCQNSGRQTLGYEATIFED